MEWFQRHQRQCRHAQNFHNVFITFKFVIELNGRFEQVNVCARHNELAMRHVNPLFVLSHIEVPDVLITF
jgi:hypothetical protein